MFPFYKYYLEIKNRILLVFFSWISLLAICYYFKESLLFTFINSNKYYNNIDLPYFIFTNVDEIFCVYLRLVVFIANQITILMILYHSLMFLTLGLYHSEYKQIKSMTVIFIVTWLCSVVLLKKFIIPFSWSFFLSFQITDDYLQPASFFFEAKIIDYFNYFTNFYYICMVNGQLLALLVLLLNNISKRIGTIKTFRKLFYLIFIIFSTITTPPDIFSQILVSFILIVIYELVIFSKYIEN